MTAATCRPLATIRLVLAFLALWASCATASAGPADCAAELNEGQKTTGQFCRTWLPCAWVMSIQETCTQTRTWLTNLGLVSRSEDLTTDRLERAARDTSTVELRNAGDDGGPALVHCLPVFRDVALCRQYLGIDPIPVRVAAVPKPRDPDIERRARMLALYKEEERARLRLGGPWWEADSALAACGQSRAQSGRAATCARAQSQVDVCVSARADWTRRKDALLAEIERLTPGLGIAATPGLSPLRGLGSQANPTQMWNDTVHGLRAMDIAACPATLPSTPMTPAQALASWTGEEQKLAADIARCDGLSRETFAAIDEGEADRGSSLADSLEASCSRLSASYANRVELARRQIGVLRAAAAMPTRSTGYATSLFKDAVQQARVEAQDPAARQLRLRAEREALERRIAADAASGRDEYNPMNALLGVMQTVVAVQNARHASMQQVPIQPSVQYAAPVMPAPVQSMRLADPGFQSPQASRQQSAQQGQGPKYYAPPNCASVERATQGTLPYCIRNRCGAKMGVHFSGGLVDIRPGVCQPVSGYPTIFASCPFGDSYVKSMQQCKRP